MVPVFSRIYELEKKIKELPKDEEDIKQRKQYKKEIKELKSTDIFKQQNLLQEENLPSFVQNPLEVEKKILDVANFQ